MNSAPATPPTAVFAVPAVMMLIAIAHMPYGYYQMLRLVVVAAAIWIAYSAWQSGRVAWPIIIGMLALLFNPFAPIHLDRETWSVFNGGGAVLFIAAWLSLGRSRQGG